MAEELKHLIEQIQREGVEKATQEAEALVSQAREKAAKVVSIAEKKAHDILLRAKNEADAFAERAKMTLDQAARDLLITLGQGCEKVVAGVLGREVEAALAGDFLQATITSVLGQQGPGEAVELTLAEKECESLAAFCAELARKSGRPIDLGSSSEILAGFKVGFKDKSVYLDYTAETVANALGAFLRPHLARRVGEIAREQLAKA